MVPSVARTALEGFQCELTETGLVIEDGIAKEEWEEIGNRLGYTVRCVQWVIGDWYLYGERAWGHKYDDCEERFGLTYSTVSKCVSISRRFDFCRRRQNLSFAHHQEVATLAVADQDILLDEAEKNTLTAKTLRERRKAIATQDAFSDDETADDSPTVALSKGDEESRKVVDEFQSRVSIVADGGVYTMDTLSAALKMSNGPTIEFVRMCEVAPSVQVIRTYGRKGLTQYQFLRTNCVSAADRIRQLAERIQTDPSSNRVKSDAAKIIQLLGG